MTVGNAVAPAELSHCRGCLETTSRLEPSWVLNNSDSTPHDNKNNKRGSCCAFRSVVSGGLNTTAEDQRVFDLEKEGEGGQKKGMSKISCFQQEVFLGLASTPSFLNLRFDISRKEKKKPCTSQTDGRTDGLRDRGTRTWLQPVENSKVRLIGWRPHVIS